MHPVEFDLIFPDLFVDSLHVFLPIAGHFLLVLHHLVTALIVDLLRLPLVRLHKHLQGFLCFPLINLVNLIGFLAVGGNKTNFFVVFLRLSWGCVLKLGLVLELLTVVKAFIFLFLLHLKAQVLLVLDIHATLLLLLQAGVVLHGHQVLNHRIVSLDITCLKLVQTLLHPCQSLILNTLLLLIRHHLLVFQLNILA